jgi:hypothetical protein
MVSVLLGGSGPTLKEVALERIPADVRIYRVNNFFLEKDYYLGRSIDCLYFSGDKRALRFYLATIRKIIADRDYDIASLATHHPNVMNLTAPAPLEALSIHDTDICSLIKAAKDEFGILPTSGIYAAVHAFQAGAHTIYLAGIDFYEGTSKYYVPLPPRLKSVLRPDTPKTGYDTLLHSKDLDIAVLKCLQTKGVKIYSTCSRPDMPSMFPLAPVLDTHLRAPDKKSSNSTTDWVAWDGFYPLKAMLILRKLRSLIR